LVKGEQEHENTQCENYRRILYLYRFCQRGILSFTIVDGFIVETISQQVDAFFGQGEFFKLKLVGVHRIKIILLYRILS